MPKKIKKTETGSESDSESSQSDTKSDRNNENNGCCKTYEDFEGVIMPTEGYTLEFENDGYNAIGFRMVIPDDGNIVVEFQGTFDNENWSTITFRGVQNDGYTKRTSKGGDYVGSISCIRKFRFYVYSVTGSPSKGTVGGRISKDVSTLEGIEVGAPTDYYTEIARGEVYGRGGIRKDIFGSITVTEKIITGCNDTYVLPEIAETLHVFSSSTSDTDGGAGARHVLLKGLDADWNVYEETVTLQGVAVVCITDNITNGMIHWIHLDLDHTKSFTSLLIF